MYFLERRRSPLLAAAPQDVLPTSHKGRHLCFKLAATEEKTKLEEAQRAGHRERREAGTEWTSKYFELEGLTFGIDGAPTDVPKYNYKHADIRPWDPRNDLYQYENNYIVCTKTRHKTPMIRTQSIVSVLDGEKVG